MVPGRHISANEDRAEIKQLEGSPSLKPERLPEPIPVCGGNAKALDLISSQPVPAAAPASAERPQRPKRAQSKSQTRPSCAQCGGLQNLRGPPRDSSLSVHSSISKKSQSKAGSRTTVNQPAANTPADVCFDLLLSCLFCHCSALLLGLCDLCSSGVSSLCFGCAEGCSQCCADVPVEELSCDTHCHSVLVQNCCEPVEFLEFCLECCQICHRS
ncbi:hypothetical protein WMY93_023580 [Mugilogobius chulae]|uniref:MyoD family inhibitor n=1 Tax=Mugilogobius chulae TaxID=88201 RepID=A0AAW0NGT9_9GOBI